MCSFFVPKMPFGESQCESCQTDELLVERKITCKGGIDMLISFIMTVVAGVVTELIIRKM